MARHPVRFRSSAGRPPGDRAPDGGDRVKQVNIERKKRLQLGGWKVERGWSGQGGCGAGIELEAMLQLLPLMIAVVIGAEQFVPETIFLPYSETEDVDFTIERPGRIGCYQW